MSDARNIRTILLAKTTLVNLQTALDTLRKKGQLTAGESGVSTVDSIDGTSMIGDMPMVFWDGTNYVAVLYVTSG